MRNSSLIIPLINEIDQNIYILTGNYTKENNSNYILYYNYFGGIKKYIDINDDYTFKNWEIILAGDKLQYYLAIFNETFHIYDFEDLKIIHSEKLYNPIFGTLKKLDTNYYYISVNNEINKMGINFNFTEGNPTFIINSGNFYEKEQKLNSISCDI